MIVLIRDQHGYVHMRDDEELKRYLDIANEVIVLTYNSFSRGYSVDTYSPEQVKMYMDRGMKFVSEIQPDYMIREVNGILGITDFKTVERVREFAQQCRKDSWFYLRVKEIIEMDDIPDEYRVKAIKEYMEKMKEEM